MEQTLIVTVLVSLVSGGAAGSTLSLIVTGCRDKRQRRQAFLGFLRRWRTEVSAPRQGPDVNRLFPDVAEVAYRSGLGSFAAEVERVRDAFTDADRFEALTSKLGSLKGDDWKGNQQPREVILKALDELIAFVG
jgi:hypothetical protein